MIRTVFLDMGNVLVLFSHEQMCAQIAALFDREIAVVRQALFESGLQHAFEAGRVSETEMRHRLESALGCAVDAGELRQAASDIFELNTAILPLLDQLKQNGARLVLVSNTSTIHFEFIRNRFDLLDRFDAFVLSFQVGALKPHPAMFRSALDRADCDPADCFFTDDLLENVEQARRMGLAAEVFTSPSEFEQQMRSRGLL